MLSDVQQCFEARNRAPDSVSSLARFSLVQSSLAFAKFIQGRLDFVLQLISCRSHDLQRLLSWTLFWLRKARYLFGSILGAAPIVFGCKTQRYVRSKSKSAALHIDDPTAVRTFELRVDSNPADGFLCLVAAVRAEKSDLLSTGNPN